MNIGIILPDLSIGQLAFETITQINNEIASGSKHDYRIFFENISAQCVQPMCGVMNISEIWSFNGLLISTTFDNTIYSLKLKSNVQRAFYLWDLEWLRGNKNYLHNLSILLNPRLSLITKNKETAKELERYSNRQANFISSTLNLTNLADKIYEKQSSDTKNTKRV